MTPAHDINYRTIALPMRRLMKALGLSQRQFADALGVPLQRIKSMTTGRIAKLSPDEIRTLVEEMQVNPAWLATGDGDMFLAPRQDAASPAMSTHDFFKTRLGAMCSTGASDAQIERETVLAACVSVMEDMAFDTEDLRIVLTLLTALAGTRPAALLARLRSAAAAGPAQEDAPPAAPTSSSASPA